MRKSRIASSLVTALLVVSWLPACRNRAPQPQDQPLVVQFGWLFDAHHLGFLWAEHRGYYAACGSSVQLLPGGLDSSPAKAVLSGVAEIGQFSGPEQLLTSRAERLPLVAVAAFHRKSPHALISLERSPVRAARDLVGRTVAVAYGDAAELHLRSLISRSGIAPDTVRLVPFRFDLTPLIRGDVDAVTGFATDQPVTLREQGQLPVVLPYYEVGLSSYGYMFFTKEKRSGEEGSRLTCFLSASRRGWSEVFTKPDEAIAYLCKVRLPESSCTAEARKLELLRPIMLDASGALATWTMTAEGFTQAEEQLRLFDQISEAAPLDAAFDDAWIAAAERSGH